MILVPSCTYLWGQTTKKHNRFKDHPTIILLHGLWMYGELKATNWKLTSGKHTKNYEKSPFCNYFYGHFQVRKLLVEGKPSHIPT